MRLFHRAEEDLWASKASGERPAADIPVVGIQAAGIPAVDIPAAGIPAADKEPAGTEAVGKPVADTAAVDTAADIETDTVGDPEPAEADSFVCR